MSEGPRLVTARTAVSAMTLQGRNPALWRRTPIESTFDAEQHLMRALSPRARMVGLTLITALVVALVPLASAPPAFAGPIAATDSTYAMCGRTFPDPHAYWAPGTGEKTQHPGRGVSPYAKGNAACAAKTFISYEEAIRGLRYLDSGPDTGKFIEVINLATTKDSRIRRVLDEERGDGMSEGLPGANGQMDQGPLYLVKVTAPEGAVLADGVAPVN